MSSHFAKLLFIPALLALLVAAWAGLVRIGWSLPPFQVAEHGSLMISGFLGTLISLERAVALAAVSPRGRWAYAVPLLSAMGMFGLLLGLPRELSIGLIFAASAGLSLLFGFIVWQHPALYTVAMALGAACWLIGNALWWSGQPVFRMVEWWVAFLVLTIAGERLELSRVMRPPPASRFLFIGILGAYLAGLALLTAQIPAGETVIGVSLIALGLWLFRYDLARRTIKRTGLTRFIAAALLAGYAWLVIGGLLRLIYGVQYAGPYYDAELHTILIGFVFSMIFGHAPIILPAVLHVTFVYLPLLYAPLALLHVALVLRVAGDLTLNSSLRAWGGMLNVVAILFFLALMAIGIIRGRKPQPVTRPAHP